MIINKLYNYLIFLYFVVSQKLCLIVHYLTSTMKLSIALSMARLDFRKRCSTSTTWRQHLAQSSTVTLAMASCVNFMTSLNLKLRLLAAIFPLMFAQINSMAFSSAWYCGRRNTSCPWVFRSSSSTNVG